MDYLPTELKEIVAKAELSLGREFSLNADKAYAVTQRRHFNKGFIEFFASQEEWDEAYPSVGYCGHGYYFHLTGALPQGPFKHDEECALALCLVAGIDPLEIADFLGDIDADDYQESCLTAADRNPSLTRKC